ncbi:MAG: DUF4153 domain-containing protein [Dialister sp.]|nr:DUF4153 domain-containing protein [Dialister sp.]
MKQWIQERIYRSLRGLARFRAASLLSFLFFLTVFFYCIAVDYLDEALRDEASQTALQIMVSLGLTALFSLFWTLYRESRDMTSTALSFAPIPVLLISFSFCRYMPMTDYFFMYVAGMALILPALSMAVLARSVRGQLFSFIFQSFFEALGMGALAFLAAAVLVLGIQNLLTEISNDWYDVAFAFAFAIFGFNTFLSCLPKKGDTVAAGGMLTLLARVVFPFYAALLLILYLYMGKIVYLGRMPEGMMNWFASFALLAYALFYFCLSETGEKRHQMWLAAAGIALLPVMTMQAYGVYIRYAAYGLTSARYVSMGCDLFALCIVIAGIARRRTNLFYGLAALLVFLFTLTPLNIIDIPVREQGARLERILNENQLLQDGVFRKEKPLSPADEDALVSAYTYVFYSEGAFRFPVAEQLSKDDNFRIFVDTHYGRDERITIFRKLWDMPVSGYSHVYRFHLNGTEPIGDMYIPAGNKEVLFRGGDYAAYVEQGRQMKDESALLMWDEDEGRLYFEEVVLRKEKGYSFSGYLLVK